MLSRKIVPREAARSPAGPPPLLLLLPRSAGRGISSSPSSSTTSKTKTAAPPRFTLDPAKLTARQQEIYEEIRRTRPRTGTAGPWGPWLMANPELCDAAQKLGRVLRYELKTLSFFESELVILFTAAWTKSTTEFEIHESEARVAGVPEAVIEELRAWLYFSGEASGTSSWLDLVCRVQKAIEESPPSATSWSSSQGVEEQHDGNSEGGLATGEKQKLKERAKAIACFVGHVLQDSGNVSDDIYGEAKQVLEENTLVELTSLVGGYTYVALTLNVFRIPAPAAATAT